MTTQQPSSRAAASRLTWVCVVLVALLVFAATIAVIQSRREHSLSHESSVRTSAARTASDVGAALFTYDYRHLRVTQARLESLATGGFARQEATSSSAVEQNLIKAHATGTASVGTVAISDVSDGHAEAFVLVTSHASATGGSTSSLNYLHMSLQLLAGHWKVGAVQTLNPPPQR